MLGAASVVRSTKEAREVGWIAGCGYGDFVLAVAQVTTGYRTSAPKARVSSQESGITHYGFGTWAQIETTAA
jgi:hypothetical protein